MRLSLFLQKKPFFGYNFSIFFKKKKKRISQLILASFSRQCVLFPAQVSHLGWGHLVGDSDPRAPVKQTPENPRR